MNNNVVAIFIHSFVDKILSHIIFVFRYFYFSISEWNHYVFITFDCLTRAYIRYYTVCPYIECELLSILYNLSKYAHHTSIVWLQYSCVLRTFSLINIMYFRFRWMGFEKLFGKLFPIQYHLYGIVFFFSSFLSSIHSSFIYYCIENTLYTFTNKICAMFIVDLLIAVCVGKCVSGPYVLYCKETIRYIVRIHQIENTL